MSKGQKAIPDRWIPYKACGSVIEGTRIICFKVPLRKVVQEKVREIEEIWDIPAVLAAIPNLGAVIDLTNTSRYYKPQGFFAANVMHKKILMPGRVLPPEDKVKEFFNAVDEFLGKDCVAVQVRRPRRGLSTADSLVGVHCTHGLNRTGYMVCRYMRDRLGIPAAEAIKRFEVARGYKIERLIYINGILGLKSTKLRNDGEHTVIPLENVQQSTGHPKSFNNLQKSQERDETRRDDCGYHIRRSNNNSFKSNRGRNTYNNYGNDSNRGNNYRNNYNGQSSYSSINRQQNAGGFSHPSNTRIFYTNTQSPYGVNQRNEGGYGNPNFNQANRGYQMNNYHGGHSYQNASDNNPRINSYGNRRGNGHSTYRNNFRPYYPPERENWRKRNETENYDY